MTALADAVLPLIRTRADVWRWNIANAQGDRMHDAVAILRQAAEDGGAKDVLAVTQRAIASAQKVIMRADDSSGIIGDACRELLHLHPIVAAKAHPPPAKLVDWMLKFQFENECDYFTIDPVAYAPALGADGMAAYRAQLAEREAALGPRPSEMSAPHYWDWTTLDWNAKRLAVFDRDVEAIVRTHTAPRRMGMTLLDTAQALLEVGEVEHAIDFAKQATDDDDGPYSRRAAEYWCQLLARYHPDELLDARVGIFRRWPSSANATALQRDSGAAWPDYYDEVFERLTPHPRDAVLFAQLSLKDVALAWNLAHNLGLTDSRTWADLAKAYEKLDPIAVLPVYIELVEEDIAATDAKHYRFAARRLQKMRKLAAGSTEYTTVNEFIADLRERYRRRPRLQEEFDRAGLP